AARRNRHGGRHRALPRGAGAVPGKAPLVGDPVGRARRGAVQLAGVRALAARADAGGNVLDFLTHLGMGFGVAFTPFNLMMAVAGVLVGILIGALPGVGPPSGVAMLLPLTSGIIMLAALYAGTMYGGTITAVLINTPGESASVVTCLDGYQMALQGRAGPALGIAAIGSFIAGTVGVVLLMLVSPALARWALSFGPPETFALMLLGLTTVTMLAGEDPLKGYISMVLGLMLAMVGFDIISG